MLLLKSCVRLLINLPFDKFFSEDLIRQEKIDLFTGRRMIQQVYYWDHRNFARKLWVGNAPSSYHRVGPLKQRCEGIWLVSGLLLQSRPMFSDKLTESSFAFLEQSMFICCFL